MGFDPAGTPKAIGNGAVLSHAILYQPVAQRSFANRLRVERDFPIEERLLVAALRLEDPRVLLPARTDWIGFELTARVDLGRRADPGHVGLDDSLALIRYKPRRGRLIGTIHRSARSYPFASLRIPPVCPTVAPRAEKPCVTS